MQCIALKKLHFGLENFSRGHFMRNTLVCLFLLSELIGSFEVHAGSRLTGWAMLALAATSVGGTVAVLPPRQEVNIPGSQVKIIAEEMLDASSRNSYADESRGDTGVEESKVDPGIRSIVDPAPAVDLPASVFKGGLIEGEAVSENGTVAEYQFGEDRIDYDANVTIATGRCIAEANRNFTSLSTRGVLPIHIKYLCYNSINTAPVQTFLELLKQYSISPKENSDWHGDPAQPYLYVYPDFIKKNRTDTFVPYSPTLGQLVDASHCQELYYGGLIDPITPEGDQDRGIRDQTVCLVERTEPSSISSAESTRSLWWKEIFSFFVYRWHGL